MKSSFAVLALVALIALPLAGQTRKPVIVQTNSAGDSVMLIDPATDQIVRVISGIEVAHGVAAAPDGMHLYISDEHLRTVDVIDTKTMSVTNRIPLSGRPNNIGITKDGRKAYVAITGAQGGVDVVDLVAGQRVKSIPMARGVHNPIVTPDGKYVVAGSTGGRTAMVIDTATDEPVWSLHFEGGVRVFCFEANPDGSTKRMFVQVTNVHGFDVVDWDTRKIVRRIELPEIPVAERNAEGIQGAPAHGILVSPGGRTLFSTSKFNSAVYAYSMPDLTYLGEVKVGTVPDWITYTPDSKKLYVANAHDNTVSVVDVAGLKETARINVGQVPKRNTTAMIPIGHLSGTN